MSPSRSKFKVGNHRRNAHFNPKRGILRSFLNLSGFYDQTTNSKTSKIPLTERAKSQGKSKKRKSLEISAGSKGHGSTIIKKIISKNVFNLRNTGSYIS